MPYADAVTHGLLRRWKFSFVRSVEPYLKEFVLRAPIAEIIGREGWTVVPVPLHGARFRWRGFNQAEWVAKTVADVLELPAANLLKRVKSTKQRARLENRTRKDLVGAFKAHVQISGRVLLCDDVSTSGATLEAAALACRDAGATSVWAYVIAKGG
jgi:predicted amidophosphoribosyltransferase